MDNLILVNRNYPVRTAGMRNSVLAGIKGAEDLTFYARPEAAAAYVRLSDELKEKGMTVGVYGAYRSIFNQARLFADVALKKGLRYALSMVAFPGRSEHHTGLALDVVPFKGGRWILDYDTLFSMKEYYSKVHEALSKHGFILRYPEGKESITGYPYEPWHIRYVGTPESEYITKNKMTLEEFLSEGIIHK